MATRREMLAGGLKTAASLALARTTINSTLLAQVAQHPDDMTLNSAPRQQTFPPPDFGLIPAMLPKEAKAVAGVESLKAHAAQHQLISGAAVVVHLLENDPALAELIVDQCGILVPESELKWCALRPTQYAFDFSQADALFAFAEKHQMLVRGHTLVWHNSVPDWLIAAPATLDVRGLLVGHINTVMGRYRVRVHSWDVVNEAILPKDAIPGGLRKSFWYERVGADYIDLAYNTAREADPKAKLTYNDYGVEYDNVEDEERRRAILELLRGMQSRRVPLDAVGIQSHIKAASPSTIGKGLADYIEAIRAMKLEVYLTELDVNEDDIASNEVAERDRLVAQTYKDFLGVALNNAAVKLVLTWGISDRRTWLNDGPTHHRKQPNRPQRSLPFDPEYRPTPAFFAMRSSFDRRSVKKQTDGNV
ncbi:endo-1,4-beta-xylanase [Edaphobacter dinghuensis]|uniref:Beta-xylanase n=1 Tax=Edaphobacter dinghuensis TaxID=1560005 RepID=A0A917HG45_9BACT|nr:endo-1,4-beta-xylanase [Edaphobacter dinghuensis]GGG78113.1 beta-xylanase [Edaphobacter dinghuensis]